MPFDLQSFVSIMVNLKVPLALELHMAEACESCLQLEQRV